MALSSPVHSSDMGRMTVWKLSCRTGFWNFDLRVLKQQRPSGSGVKFLFGITSCSGENAHLHAQIHPLAFTASWPSWTPEFRGLGKDISVDREAASSNQDSKFHKIFRLLLCFPIISSSIMSRLILRCFIVTSPLSRPACPSHSKVLSHSVVDDWLVKCGRLPICVCLIWSFTTPLFFASRLNILSSWSLPNAAVSK